MRICKLNLKPGTPRVTFDLRFSTLTELYARYTRNAENNVLPENSLAITDGDGGVVAAFHLIPVSLPAQVGVRASASDLGAARRQL